MAFWALGALDKMKNLTENSYIKNVSKKVVSYIATAQNDTREEPQKNQKKMFNSQVQEDLPYIEPKKILSSKEKMEIQLRQYKKLVKIQQQILQKHNNAQRQELVIKQALLQKENLSLIEREQKERKEASKNELIERIQSGERSIEQVISENILIKEKIMQAQGK